ncbi:MAG TPA: hypothetical protein DCR40_16435 [Prolixibacteraceae bacterium]|nr:hypothetical protein [Prolixibacteraceae bacterium]
MKTKKQFLILLLISVFLILGASCKIARVGYYHPTRTVILQTNPNGKMPPGHMKKATGAKSAKQYAPGQVKKQNGQGKKHKKNK